MKNKLSILLLVSLLSMNAVAQWNKVKSSTIAFKIKNAGLNVNGSFGNATVQINIDESNPSNSFFNGVVQANSVKTGINLRDNHLKDKEEFFNVSKFPTLAMKSIKVVPKTPEIYTVTWILTMKGVSRQFTSDVTVKKSQETLLLSCSVVVNRNDWNVGGRSLTMGDNVTILLSATVSK
jgi:polyisoprenoid-binding protein YceI